PAEGIDRALAMMLDDRRDLISRGHVEPVAGDVRGGASVEDARQLVGRPRLRESTAHRLSTSARVVRLRPPRPRTPGTWPRRGSAPAASRWREAASDRRSSAPDRAAGGPWRTVGPG